MSPTVAAGPWTTRLEKVRDLFANSATFQAWVFEPGDAVAAKLRTHAVDILPADFNRPHVVVCHGEQFTGKAISQALGVTVRDGGDMFVIVEGPFNFPVTITRSVGTATVNWVAHGFSASDLSKISGANETEYNGLQTILTVPDADSFTFAVSGSPDSPATGTPKAGPDPSDSREVSYRFTNQLGAIRNEMLALSGAGADSTGTSYIVIDNINIMGPFVPEDEETLNDEDYLQAIMTIETGI